MRLLSVLGLILIIIGLIDLTYYIIKTHGRDSDDRM